MIYSSVNYQPLEFITKNGTVSLSLIEDILTNNIEWRLEQLVPKQYLEDDILHFHVYDKLIASWSNLLREWYSIGVRKDITTFLYWARVKYHPRHIKIGITYDIAKRSDFPNNKYYDYHIIRWTRNRYACAYLEYKIRTLFCMKKSEIIDGKQLQDVIDYANNFHWKREMKEELELLGWNFK